MMREAAIFNRVKAGDGTIEEVVANIYADVDPRLHGTTGRSTLTHLEYLIDMGRIAVRKGRYYSRD